MESEGLHEYSSFYRTHVNYYEEFTRAEDSPGLVEKTLLPLIRNKDVLDLGCGTGKYCKCLSDYSRSYIGLDQSAEALKTAAKSTSAKKCTLIEANAEELPIQDNSLDIVFASWVLGTIESEQRRFRVLQECKRVLRPNGIIALVENDIGGDFEFIRGRYPDTTRTKGYNDWLEHQAGFSPHLRFTTYFSFTSLGMARSVFGAIWGNTAARRVWLAKLGHNVVVYTKHV